MNYYKNNAYALIHTIPSIPFLFIFLAITLLVIIIYILMIELYDSNYFYAIKYKDQDYLEVVVPLETSEEILKYECLEYNNEEIKINDISILTPETKQLYNDEYNIVSIKISEYDNIPSDVIVKVKLLKNKQSIFKKLFITK